MTEIIGHDDEQRPRGWRDVPDPYSAADLDEDDREPVEPHDLDEDWEPPEDEDRPSVLAAFWEAPSLAVLAALGTLGTFTIGVSHQFFAYPFSLGVSSLDGNFANIHPLRDYLSAILAPAVFAVVGLLAGLVALRRGRSHDASWVRPLAAGAALACILAVALFALGAYRTGSEQLDLGTTSTGSA